MKRLLLLGLSFVSFALFSAGSAADDRAAEIAQRASTDSIANTCLIRFQEGLNRDGSIRYSTEVHRYPNEALRNLSQVLNNMISNTSDKDDSIIDLQVLKQDFDALLNNDFSHHTTLDDFVKLFQVADYLDIFDIQHTNLFINNPKSIIFLNILENIIHLNHNQIPSNIAQSALFHNLKYFPFFIRLKMHKQTHPEYTIQMLLGKSMAQIATEIGAIKNTKIFTAFSILRHQRSTFRHLRPTTPFTQYLMTANRALIGSKIDEREAVVISLIPTGFSIQNLIDCRLMPEIIISLESTILDLSSLNLISLNGLFDIPEINTVLKLYLFYNFLTVLPDSIGQLAQLRDLYLFGCTSLTALPNSIGQLARLTNLNLNDCTSLTGLPNSIGQLTLLTNLNLFRCTSLTALPNSIGQLTLLTNLNLAGCTSLTALPNSIGQLARLTNLNLAGCTSLTALPDSIGQLAQLSTLHLDDCRSLTTLPDSIGQLAELRELYISFCRSLTALPNSIGQLAHLERFELTHCRSLTTLPDSIGQLAQLRKLSLDGCGSLTTLPNSIGQLTQLRELSLDGCGSLTALPNSIGNLAHLEYLRLNNCTSLTVLPENLRQRIIAGYIIVTGLTQTQLSAIQAPVVVAAIQPAQVAPVQPEADNSLLANSLRYATRVIGLLQFFSTRPI